MSKLYTKMCNILNIYNFDFKNIPETFKCVICNNILKNAKQTACGCRACDKCLRNYLQNGPKPCPNNQPDCSGDLLKFEENINQDNATNKEIGNLKVKCPLKSCQFSGILRNIAEHIEICDFREITCDLCKNRFSVKEKLNHDQNICDMRNVKCQYCNDIMKYIQLKSEHLNADSDKLCNKYVAMCPNNCSTLHKVNWKQHLPTCANKKLECPFYSLGCDMGKMSKEKLEEHIKDNLSDHVSGLINKVKSNESEMKQLKMELESQKQSVQELILINEKLKEPRIKMDAVIEEYSKKVPPTVDRSVILRNGSFIWKFNNFATRRLDADNGGRVSITSDPFYTSEFGYKMCLRIYPAGDGVARGTHLSVFFAIMKGDYDDLLSWPFKQKVTLSIFDLESGSKHHFHTFISDSLSVCYQKPTDDCNIVIGSPKFILLSLLTCNDSIYCKNDSIYIKIDVESDDQICVMEVQC